MKLRLVVAAAALLATGLTFSTVQAAESAKSTPHHAAKKTKAAAKPSIEDQLNALRQELSNQAGKIESLKQGLDAKDAQLKKAEAEAVEARTEANKTAAALASQQEATTSNSAAVSTLEAAVKEVKGSQSSFETATKAQGAELKKAIESPSVLHYKGVILTPTGFFNGESYYRTHATGGDLPTAFSSIPYEHADAYSLSEAGISGRQSRFGFIAEGKIGWGTVRAMMEADFLGAGTTSNNNQSSSYLLRQRLMMAELETASGWTFSAGQGWSLAAENKKGINTAAAQIALPMQIDPNYVTGLVWTRAGNLRVTRSFKKVAVAVSAENPQIVYSAALAGNTPWAVLGSAGTNGGTYNAAVSTCSATTSIVNYQNEVVGTSNAYLPVSKTYTACSNLANISFNQAPDMIVKAAFDPGIGHYEILGIARFAHETVYPGETTNSYLYGGKDPYGNKIVDISTGAAVATAASTEGAYTNSIVLGGLGASARLPFAKGKYVLGAKGLYGPGVGRYGNSNLTDVTANAAGELVPLHNFSGLATVEYTPTPRLTLYAYYGGDYASRAAYSGKSLAAPTAAQATDGTWGGHWAAAKTAAVGYGSPLASNSACNSTTAPGYNGGSTGYYAGASCGASTRNTQEITAGYWYDLYKGDKGRFRQGFQYGYAVREGWSGADGIGAKGIENMIFTSFRYFLP